MHAGVWEPLGCPVMVLWCWSAVCRGKRGYLSIPTYSTGVVIHIRNGKAPILKMQIIKEGPKKSLNWIRVPPSPATQPWAGHRATTFIKWRWSYITCWRWDWARWPFQVFLLLKSSILFCSLIIRVTWRWEEAPRWAWIYTYSLLWGIVHFSNQEGLFVGCLGVES